MRFQIYASLIFLLAGSIGGAASLGSRSIAESSELSDSPCFVRPLPWFRKGAKAEPADSKDVLRTVKSDCKIQAVSDLALECSRLSVGIDIGYANESALKLKDLLKPESKFKQESAALDSALLYNNLGLAYLISSSSISDYSLKEGCLELAHNYLLESRLQSSKHPDSAAALAAAINHEQALNELSKCNRRWRKDAASARFYANHIKKKLAASKNKTIWTL